MPEEAFEMSGDEMGEGFGMEEPMEEPTVPQELSTDELAASLGFITTLSEKMMMPQPMAPAEAKPAPEESGLASAKEEIIGEVHALRDDLNMEGIKKEFQGIKKEIEGLLNEDDTNDDTQETET